MLMRFLKKPQIFPLRNQARKPFHYLISAEIGWYCFGGSKWHKVRASGHAHKAFETLHRLANSG